jgi:hypothetical protein
MTIWKRGWSVEVEDEVSDGRQTVEEEGKCTLLGTGGSRYGTFVKRQRKMT